MSRSKTISKTKNLKNIQLYNRMLLLAMVVCGIAYLIGINDLSIKNYMLLEERRRANTVRNEINQLENKAMSLSSYNNLAQRITDLQMVKVDQVKYFNANPAVALK